jgi:L-fuconolactonase
VNAATQSGQTGRLQVIDAHFHVWDPMVQEIPWIQSPENFVLNRRWTIEDLEAEYAKLGVDFLGGVYVEVDAADHELEDRLVEENPSKKILAQMLRAQLSPSMRVPIRATGIREPLHVPTSSRGRCLEDSFLSGLRALAKRGMPFELCNRGGELGDMVKAFGQVPEVTVIIDHLGNITELDPLSRAALKGMAALPNAYIKVSGDKPVNLDVVKFVRDVFSPDRLLFASNWPVVNLESSLAEHFERVQGIFGDDEDFFMDNAKRAYGLTTAAKGESDVASL